MQTDLVSTILPGLLSSPKYVPQWYTYDKLGSELFDRVTNENPDYHLYRVEMSLLKEHTDKIIDNFDETSVFAELGAGNSSKMHRLIEAILKKEGSLRFIPIDISKEYVEESAKNLIKLFPLLDVQPFVGHYLDGMVHVKSLQGSKLLVFLGSSFSSIPEAQMLPFLETIRDAIEGNRDRLLIGLDTNRNPERVKKIYSHPTFVDFMRNILTRLNKDFQADFMQDKFDPYVEYNKSNDQNIEDWIIEDPEYLNTGFRSKCQQTVTLERIGKTIDLEEGEVIHINSPGKTSIKWDWKQFEKLAKAAGLTTEQIWTDQDNLFTLGLMKADLQ
ncbi:histidine N-alpha-methyltransferase-like isoform X1 [Ptychodera flava]|uniref:histidine N-alpha-methyltransferase-like isoform X1 n=1 Tax=Ptychodera flava TaxID=63121 RepID=UPI00396A01EA